MSSSILSKYSPRRGLIREPPFVTRLSTMSPSKQLCPSTSTGFNTPHPLQGIQCHTFSNDTETNQDSPMVLDTGCRTHVSSYGTMSPRTTIRSHITCLFHMPLGVYKEFHSLVLDGQSQTTPNTSSCRVLGWAYGIGKCLATKQSGLDEWQLETNSSCVSPCG